MNRWARYSQERQKHFTCSRKRENRRYRARKIFLSTLTTLIRQQSTTRAPSSARLLDTATKILYEDDLCHIVYMCGQAGFRKQMEAEYAPEAEAILLRLREWGSVEQLQHVIADVFDDFFGNPDITPEQYRQTACRIWDAWALLLSETAKTSHEASMPLQHEDVVLIKIG